MVSNPLAHIETPTNTRPLASSLPIELLQDIFIRSAHDYYYEHQDGNDVTSTVPCWVNISYVCRRWRNVALECPTLWTYVFIASQRWTEELLRRSKQASLKICFLPQERLSEWLKNLETLLSHVERIQELRLQLPSSRVQRILSKLSSRTPRLQSLSIVSMVDFSYHPSFHLDFHGYTPALRTLELVSCPARLDSFNVKSLTSLCLHHIPHKFQRDIKDFIGLLSCMDGLKSLSFSNCFPDSAGFLSSEELLAFETISLPHLSRLFVRSRLATIITFLSCVHIPAKTNVSLKVRYEGALPLDDYDVFCPLLAQRYNMVQEPALSGPIIRSLVLVTDLMEDARLICSAYERDFTALSVDVWDSPFPFRLQMQLLGEDMEDIMVKICRSLPLSNVESLCVTSPRCSPMFWKRMLSCLPDLRYMKLSTDYMPDLSALSPTDLTSGSDMPHQDVLASGQMLAPLLEELELENLAFSEGSVDLEVPAMSRHALFDVLSKRRGSRGRLTVTRCEMDAHYVDLVMVWNDGDVHIVSERTYPWIDLEVKEDGWEEQEQEEEQEDSGGW